MIFGQVIWNWHILAPGINLVHNQQKVSRVVFKEAFNAGWRVGDEILEVDGKKVGHTTTYAALQTFETNAAFVWVE